MVWGDSKKIRTVVANLTANAVKYTDTGRITVRCRSFNEPEGLREDCQVAVEIVIEDTGRGIEEDKLNNIFRQFENVQHEQPREMALPGVGLGLAVVARIVEQLGGQLRVDSELARGSRFSFLVPFVVYEPGQTYDQARAMGSGTVSSMDSASTSSVDAPSTRSSGSYRSRSVRSEVDSLVQALATPAPVHPQPHRRGSRGDQGKGKERADGERPDGPSHGEFPVAGSYFPIRSVKVEDLDIEPRATGPPPPGIRSGPSRERRPGLKLAFRRKRRVAAAPNKLRVLVVDVSRAPYRARRTLLNVLTG